MKVDNRAAEQAYASAAYRGAIGPAGRVSPHQPMPPDIAPAGGPTTDSVHISAQGRVRAQALEAVRSSPRARPKLVMELRSQIKAGTYSVDNHALAQQLAKRLPQP